MSDFVREFSLHKEKKGKVRIPCPSHFPVDTGKPVSTSNATDS
jgi:hypothetical protein